MFGEEEYTGCCLYPFSGFNKKLFAVQYCTVHHFTMNSEGHSVCHKICTRVISLNNNMDKEECCYRE
jgi:hypothetical protein